MINCSECENGEIKEPVIIKISHPQAGHPELRATKWVCEEHYTLLADDYDKEINILERR